MDSTQDDLEIITLPDDQGQEIAAFNHAIQQLFGPPFNQPFEFEILHDTTKHTETIKLPATTFLVGANRYEDFDRYKPARDLPHADGWWWLAGKGHDTLYNDDKGCYTEVAIKDLALF